MVVTTLDKIFIMKDWEIIKVHHSKKSQETWEKMGFFMPLPNYSEEDYPFLIVSGKFSVALLNVKTGYFEPLINTKASVSYNQQAFSFQRTKFGVKLNLSTGRSLFNGNKRLEWV